MVTEPTCPVASKPVTRTLAAPSTVTVPTSPVPETPVTSTLAFACTGYTITWAGGSAPTPELSKPFEVSFMETSPTIINAIFKQL